MTKWKNGFILYNFEYQGPTPTDAPCRISAYLYEFVIFATFSNGSLLGFSIYLEFLMCLSTGTPENN